MRREGIGQPQPRTSDIDGDITEQIKPQRESGGLIEIDQSPRRLRGLDDEPIIDSGRIDADALTPGTHELTATFTADSGCRHRTRSPSRSWVPMIPSQL